MNINQGNTKTMATTTKTKTTDKPDDLVQVPRPKGGDEPYMFPRKYATGMSVSAVIRALVSDGWTQWQIHKITGLRYQHVRNVLTSPTKKK